ncbi:uncharacterized protein [Watersipora subatra]|uniref:uncharacterized protein n=1 Tax=Watersipora subatra TaxID=2589382 RepID=UPI00355B39F7
MSQNDKQFLRILETGARKLENGSWCFPLPFNDETLLPNNRAQAEKRFEQLANKLKGNATYKKEYDQFMREIIDNGHAELAPDEPVNEKTWYIPHFGVRHPRKDKLRVVFDASAKYKGQSLNDQLHTGLDMMNSLVGILLRFRTKRIAISCDIEKMFYNFFVTTDHRDFLHFLWKDANDIMANPQEYRMTRQLFGATSPGVATIALRKIAKEYEEEMPIASNFILEDFYVDDSITSVDTVEEAANLIQSAIEICRRANLRLHKFLTNNREVLANIPASERVKEAQNLNLFRDKLPTERTLGLEWSVENDTIEFQNSMKSMPSIRKGILLVISQLYDPLGLLAPFILKGRQISQKTCGEKGEWDAEVLPELKSDWENWKKELSRLESIKIERCVVPKEFGCVTQNEIHHFCDASLNGYGACSYVRLVNNRKEVHTALLMAKSRVVPLKQITVPRLELQSAVEAVKLSSIIKAELKVNIDKEFFCQTQQ